MYPPERRARQGHGEALAEELVDRAEPERADRQPRHFGIQRRPLPGTLGKQERDRLVANTPHRERKRGRGRRVEPLDVVDGQQDRTAAGERAQSSEERDRDRTLIGHGPASLSEQQRELQGTALRGGERGENLVENRLEEVAERRKRQRGLGRARRRGQNPKLTASRGFDAGAPQGRLPDPGLALDQKRGPTAERRHERAHHSELILSSDHATGHLDNRLTCGAGGRSPCVSPSQ